MKFSLIATLASAAFAAPQSHPSTPAVPAVTDVLGRPEFSTLLSLAQQSPAVLELLTTATGYTLFAPTNDAFTSLSNKNKPLFDAVIADADLLTTVLSYHALAGTVFTPDGAAKLFVDPVAPGTKLGVTVSADNAVTLSSGLLTQSSVQSSVEIASGIIHVIDEVLIPPQSISDTAAAAGLSSLAQVLTDLAWVDAVNGLEGVTVFAPTNEAFSSLFAQFPSLNEATTSSVVALHVGQGVFYSTDIVAAGSAPVTSAFNGLGLTAAFEDPDVKINAPANEATVAVADVLVANGVVHVIDTVLLPELSTIGSTKITPSFTNPAESTASAPDAGAAVSGASKSFGISGLAAVAIAALVF